jgi:hypothetical protein
MSILNRFPSRIRFVNADGYLTPEALRMLDLLVDRVGGPMGDQGEDVFALAPASDAGAGSGSADVLGLPSPDSNAGPDVTGVPTDPGHMAPVELQPVAHAVFGEMTFQGSSE